MKDVKVMDTLDAIEIIENDGLSTYDEVITAFQFLIDTGTVWKLQGFYGRTASDLIEKGLCHKVANGVKAKKDPDYGRHNTIDWMIR